MTDEALIDLLHGLQRNNISDPRVFDAMARTPRELFITEHALKRYAYEDEPLPIECAQTISQPFIVAYMTERLNVAQHHDVLEIGTGSGYQTAILACLARHICTVERHLALHRLARERFERLDLRNISSLHGDGAEGWPGARLFDRIIVTAGASEIPDALLDQLAPCGALIAPIGPYDEQRITLVTRENGRDAYQSLISVRFVPLVERI
jgi:protein-L-isoaspartate(D-aspartate) O-methyltransferase